MCGPCSSVFNDLALFVQHKDICMASKAVHHADEPRGMCRGVIVGNDSSSLTYFVIEKEPGTQYTHVQCDTQLDSSASAVPELSGD